MLVSDPLPSPPPAVTVEGDAALAIAKRDHDFGPAMQRGAPVVTLRMVSVGLPEDDPTPHPAWVLTWRNSRLDLHGPPTLSAQKREALVADADCIFLVVIDAATGSAKYVVQLCG